jgi:hypothetical protein
MYHRFKMIDGLFFNNITTLCNPSRFKQKDFSYETIHIK